ALLDVGAGALPGDPYAAPHQEGSFLEALHRPPRRLRVGFTTSTPTGLPCHPAVVTAVERTAALLAELGHQVEPIALSYDVSAASAAAAVVTMATLQAMVGQEVDGRGHPLRDDELEPFTHTLLEMSHGLTGRNVIEALSAIELAG